MTSMFKYLHQKLPISNNAITITLSYSIMETICHTRDVLCVSVIIMVFLYMCCLKIINPLHNQAFSNIVACKIDGSSFISFITSNNISMQHMQLLKSLLLPSCSYNYKDHFQYGCTVYCVPKLTQCAFVSTGFLGI